MDSISKSILVLYMPVNRVGDGLFWSRKVDHPFSKIPPSTLPLTLSLVSHYPDPLPPPGHFCLAGWYPARHQASISHGTLAMPGKMKDQNR